MYYLIATSNKVAFFFAHPAPRPRAARAARARATAFIEEIPAFIEEIRTFIDFHNHVKSNLLHLHRY